MELSTTILIMLLTGAACVLQSTGSVCPYNVTGCDCIGDGVVCNGLQSMPPLYTGPDVLSCSYLGFDTGNLTSIPPGSLPAGLHTFESIRNPITVIADDAFVESATTLEEFFITRAQLKQLPTALLNLTNLSSMKIVDTPIETLNENVLLHISTTLMSLTITNASFHGWPSVLSNFRLLTELILDGNSLQEIPENAFILCKDSLKSLSLVSTGLTHVPKALSSLSTLQFLDLSGNKFVDVNEFDSIFPFGSKLLKLNLNFAGLTRIANFSTLTNLTEIHLNNNNISDSNAGSLPLSLTKLDIAFNTLSLVPIVVAKLSKLSLLELINNKISRIEPSAFPASLNTLRLSNNQITEINPADFPSSLTDLVLSYNQITEIQSQPFPTNLYSLDVSHNQITHINTTNCPSTLSFLDLSFNKIKKIDPDSFPSGLGYLHLDYNNISFISNTTLANLSRLTSLFLNNNPITSIPTLAFSDLKLVSNLYLDSTNLTEIPTAIGDLQKSELSGTISLENIVSMNCPCPQSPKLLNWIMPLTNIQGECSNGYRISQYLLTTCEIETSPTVTETTTKSGRACLLGFSVFSIYGALFLLLSLHLYNN